MPGSEVVQKQTVLGGAAGIALLLFALAYRFYPTLPYSAIRAPSSATGSVDNTVFTAQAQKSASAQGIATGSGENAHEVVFFGPPASLAPPPPPPPKAIAALLKKADDALEKDRLLEPKDGALTFYRQALDADPKNASAKAGIEKIHNLILQQAGQALDRGDENESSRLTAALRDFALDDANISSLESRLKKLRQTTPLLTRAADFLRDSTGGSVAANANQASALDVYRQVLKIDPENKLADQGLAQIERSFLDRALGAAAQDDFGGADEILANASSIRPGSHELLDTRTQIEGIRRQRATAVMSQANSAIDAGNPDLGELLATKAQGLSPDVAGVDAFNERLRNARLYASFKPGQVFSDVFVDRSGAAPALVVVPTGVFAMGSPAQEIGHRTTEEPQREVKISVGFALGRDEVSVADFRAFVDDTNYQSDAEKMGSSIIYDEDSGRTIERRGVTWRNDYVGAIAGDALPVLHVSWNDARAYVQWLSKHSGKGYRLPSEAEYEYALRAGTSSRFWWGEGNPTKPLANLTGDGDKSPTAGRRWTNAFPHYSDGSWGPAALGGYPPNPFGLRDIDGNVSDWVEDCWHDNYLRAPSDSRAWVNPGCERHVVRGTSWGSAPDQARSASRTNLLVQAHNAQVGFRIARDL